MKNLVWAVMALALIVVGCGSQPTEMESSSPEYVKATTIIESPYFM